MCQALWEERYTYFGPSAAYTTTTPMANGHPFEGMIADPMYNEEIGELIILAHCCDHWVCSPANGLNLRWC
jgi:hypothetical protein